MGRRKTERMTIEKLDDTGAIRLVQELLHGMNERIEDIEAYGNEKEISRAREELRSQYWQVFSMGLSAIRLEEFDRRIEGRMTRAVS